MSRWTTLVLAVLLFAGLAVVIFVSQPELPPSALPPTFLAFSRAEVNSFDVKGPLGEIKFERDAKVRERWRILVGSSWVRAASMEVEDLLNDLSRIAPKQVFRAAEIRAGEREKWGMTAPGLTVRLGFDAPVREMRAAFGTDLLERKNTYAELEPNSDVFVVPAATVEKLKSLQHEKYRERRPVGLSQYDVKDFSLRRADGLIFEVQKATGGTTWEVLVPYKGAADPVRIAEILDRVLNVEVAEFVPDTAPDPDKYGFAEPWAEVKVRKEGSETLLVLEFGKDAGEGRRFFREKGEPAVYVCAKPLPDAIVKLDPAAIRDRNVLRIGWARIESIEFVHVDQPWKLLRVLERWDVEKPERTPADVPRVEAFLSLLREIEATKFLDGDAPEKHGLAIPEGAPARLILRGVDESGNRTLLLGKKDAEGGVPVRLLPPEGSKDQTPVAVVPAGFLDRLLEGWLSFRGLEVFEAHLDEILGVSRKRAGGEEESYLYEKNTWKAGPGGKEPDDAALTQVLSFLLHLDCAAFVAKTKEGLDAWGLGDPPAGPAITVRLGKKGGEERKQTLLLGKAHPGGNHYARMADGDLVFLLPDQVLRGASPAEFFQAVDGPWDKRPAAPAPPPEEPKKDGSAKPETPKEPEKAETPK